MKDQITVVTLANLADGAALELFQSEVGKVLANILDPNTDPKQERSITLKVAIKPDEDRVLGGVKISVSSKLAGLKGVKTNFYFGRHGGQLVATEYNPKQAGLFDDKAALREVPVAPAATAGSQEG